MQQQAGRRRAWIPTAAALFMLSAGVSAIGFIGFELPTINLDPNQLFQVNIQGLSNTGFSIQSRDGSALTINGGSSTYDPARALQDGQRVQEGFVLLDGTLSLDADARRLDGTRASTVRTFRLDVRRRAFRPEFLARALVRQGVVRDVARARTRARAMRLADTRVMRLVERRSGARWIRAVRTMEARQRAFRPRTRPDGVVGHFGFAQPEDGDPYVWAVVDRNGKYAVGLTVDRDNDGVPNSTDNCIGSRNPSQSDTDDDGFGDDCDLDDDNDSVADVKDNCAFTPNLDQADQDFDGAGDVCDDDADGDAVIDADDACRATALGSLVNSKGCSIADTCPCDNSWRNHGAYVKCVAQTSSSFLSAGLITSAEKDAIVSAAGRSACGF